MIRVNLWILILILAGLLPGTARAQDCSNPPPPVLQLGAPETREPMLQILDARAIMRLSGPAAPHALMAMRYILDAEVAISPIPEPGSCSASTVMITFGVVRRDVLLARETAGARCIRDALLAHERAHSRIVAAGARAFIEDRRPELLQLVGEALRHRPSAIDAAPPGAFMGAIYAGLRKLMVEFGARMRGPLRQAGDSPAALARLAGACGGALGTLDSAVRLSGATL